jgi:hypothetical protein
MSTEQTDLLQDIQGRALPCPVCAAGLPFRFSCKGKPYCVCDACGIQIFFRGERGIARLRELVQSEILVAAQGAGATEAVSLYNRLQRLKAQRDELESKRGFVGLVLEDPDLDHAIKVVDAEIARVQEELKELS